jgi:hypothetical protein
MMDGDADDSKALEASRWVHLSALNARTRALVEGPFEHKGLKFQLNMFDRINLLGLAQIPITMYQKMVWRAIDGKYLELDTYGEFMAFQAIAFGAARARLLRHQQIEQRLAEATSIQELQAATDSDQEGVCQSG